MPSQSRLGCRLRDDLDDVSGAQLVAQRNHASVDLGADASVADLGVNGVGEINGGGVARQDDHLALGREGVDLFGVEIDLQGGEKLGGIGDIALPLDHLAQPGQALLVFGGDGAVLVFPVRRDAFLRHLVHLLGANLHFEGVAVLGDDGGVERLVKVGPRHGDEVLDAAGDGTPEVVNDAEGGITVLDGIGDDAHGEEIVDLIHGQFSGAAIFWWML